MPGHIEFTNRETVIKEIDAFIQYIDDNSKNEKSLANLMTIVGEQNANKADKGDQPHPPIYTTEIQVALILSFWHSITENRNKNRKSTIIGQVDSAQEKLIEKLNDLIKNPKYLIEGLELLKFTIIQNPDKPLLKITEEASQTKIEVNIHTKSEQTYASKADHYISTSDPSVSGADVQHHQLAFERDKNNDIGILSPEIIEKFGLTDRTFSGLPVFFVGVKEVKNPETGKTIKTQTKNTFLMVIPSEEELSWEETLSLSALDKCGDLKQNSIKHADETYGLKHFTAFAITPCMNIKRQVTVPIEGFTARIFPDDIDTPNLTVKSAKNTMDFSLMPDKAITETEAESILFLEADGISFSADTLLLPVSYKYISIVQVYEDLVHSVATYERTSFINHPLPEKFYKGEERPVPIPDTRELWELFGSSIGRPLMKEWHDTIQQISVARQKNTDIDIKEEQGSDLDHTLDGNNETYNEEQAITNPEDLPERDAYGKFRNEYSRGFGSNINTGMFFNPLKNPLPSGQTVVESTSERPNNAMPDEIDTLDEFCQIKLY